MMKIHIDFFKATGKYYTSEEMLLESWPLGDRQYGFENCLVKLLTTEVEGKTRVRYAGMTAVCSNWWDYPVLATVPGIDPPEPRDARKDTDFEERCDHCIHTYGQHNVDGKSCSRCDENYPVGDARVCAGFKKQPEVTNRDKVWVKALNAEFKIGGAILTEDERWVKEKDTYPERWARIVKLAVTPRDIKLHEHQPPLKVTIGPSCLQACQNCEGGDHERCSMKQCHCSKRENGT